MFIPNPTSMKLSWSHENKDFRKLWQPSSMRKTNLGGGNSIYFLCSPLFGEDFQFDEHIFQMGWFNHQPEMPWVWKMIHLPKMALFAYDFQGRTNLSQPKGHAAVRPHHQRRHSTRHNSHNSTLESNGWGGFGCLLLYLSIWCRWLYGKSLQRTVIFSYD